MTNELKQTLIGTIIGAILTGGVSLYTYFDSKYGIESKTVETLSKYFDSVDKDMSYNVALEKVYEDTKSMQTRIDELESGNIDSILIKNAQEYGESENYYMALSLLMNVESSDEEKENLISRYGEKFEDEVLSQADFFINNSNVNAAKLILNKALDIVPESKRISEKLSELNSNDTNSLVKMVPAYQCGGNTYEEYSPDNDGATNSFVMAGITYTNGMTFDADINIFNDSCWALYNLDGKYTNLSFIVGHVDGTDLDDGTVLQVFTDGNLQKEINLKSDMYPKDEVIDLSGVKQLKLQVLPSGNDHPVYGIGNPMIT